MKVIEAVNDDQKVNEMKDDVKDGNESCETDDEVKKEEISITIKSDIKSWNDYPDLLQVIGINDNKMKIEFDLKSSTAKKIKYTLKNINQYYPKLSTILTIGSHKKCVKKDGIDVNGGKLYNFAVFSTNRQISNCVRISIPKTQKNNNKKNENYKPLPPSIDTIQQFYDSSKKNILILWDFPKETYGDIVYKISVSDDSNNNNEQLTKLPLKIPITSKDVKLNISTISIIGDKKYESDASQTIIINPSKGNESIEEILPSSSSRKSTITDQDKFC